MYKIFLLHPGRANYPELVAYQDYYAARGVDVVAGTLSDYKALADKADFLVWAIMGFYPKQLASDFVIHDYRSLSVGGSAGLKDIAKRYLNARPNLRIFQNTRQQNIMKFNDDVPSVILPMGVPKWIFEVPQQPPDAEDIADFCYIGDMSFERGFHLVIEAFLENFREVDASLLLVGKPEPRLYERYAGKRGLVFAGALPQREALGLVARSSIAVSYFPYHRPHCYQTPTKLLEYAALGKKILCNDSPSNVACCEDLHINSIITSSSIFTGMTAATIETATPNQRANFTQLAWDNVIEKSNINSYISQKINFSQ
ncbi:glycosyltransferase [Paraburkholderia strydomiana]|uniref:glycosyltransferase n=1 Tax=Paraburkholderia strydomiana TaxID=1245417 RepID=UPI0038B739C7